ncbi:hypothetical protein QWZ10_10520 [Paracoccus cavernae]|uniref:GNAT family N-acetyltransferase n=1 Tax=Paracoccus cavernae TaxID=1571207 RepID=A0ABT8D6X3_9RHOB|nr:hypothetical protein [Paracoccus cavernae]
MAVIRKADAGDVLQVVDLIEDLRAAVNGPIPVDRAWTARTVAGLIADPDGAVWVSAGGFIAGALRPTIINPRRSHARWAGSRVTARDCGCCGCSRHGRANAARCSSSFQPARKASIFPVSDTA